MARQRRGLAAERRRGITQRPNVLVLPLDLVVHLRLMIVIPRQRGINLGEREVRMVLLNRLGVPAVGEMVEDDFDDLDVRVVNPKESSLKSS